MEMNKGDGQSEARTVIISRNEVKPSPKNGMTLVATKRFLGAILTTILESMSVRKVWEGQVRYLLLTHKNNNLGVRGSVA
jgi:hypothetical protein